MKFNGLQINAIRSILQSPIAGGSSDTGANLFSQSPKSLHTHSRKSSFLLGKKIDRDTDKHGFMSRKDYFPKSQNQQKYVDALHSPQNSIVLCYGPAGTGKTMFACNAAVNELEKGNVKKIILTRPIVSVDEELGFLPGNIVSKMDPWTRPIMDIFMEFYSKNEVENMIQDGIIEISPLAYMRGRTFKKAFIIADEMQNSSPNQMLMLITRIGTNSKMVINGDLRQSDRCENNGLLDLVNRLNRYKPKGVEYIELGSDDVFRSAVVSQIVKLYEMDMNRVPISFPKENIVSPVFTETENQFFTLTDEEIIELERNSELEVAGMDEDQFVENYLNSPSLMSSMTSGSSFGVDIHKVEANVNTNTDVNGREEGEEGEEEEEEVEIEVEVEVKGDIDKREIQNIMDDIVIVYKEGHNDSALIPKSHITKNIIRFFNSGTTDKPNL